MREWNGDQTDWGLNFNSQPQVLRQAGHLLKDLHRCA
ncbi:MAG: hypothetical protein ABI389_04215 [Rhodanobacter sp.]